MEELKAKEQMKFSKWSFRTVREGGKLLRILAAELYGGVWYTILIMIMKR